METLDYLRSGALLVAFFATAFVSRATWILADTIATFTFGVACTVFPEILLDYETDGTIDLVHLYLFRLYGVLLLSSALNWFLSRKTKDETVVVGFMFSRVFSLIVLLMAQVFAQYRSKGKQRLNDNHIYFGILGTAVWMMGNLIHIFRSSTLGGYSVAVNNRLCKHIIIDVITTIASFAMTFGFSQFLMESGVGLKDFKVDIIHVHLGRAIAASQLGAVFLGFTALNFENNEDKKHFLISRAVLYTLVSGVISYYQYRYQMGKSNNLVYFHLGSLAVMLLNALLGAFWSDSKQKKS